jgi:hypothetical protein
MKLAKFLAAGAALAVLAASSAADAASVLYRRDGVVGTDYLSAALTAGGHAVTFTSGDLSSYTLSDYDLVIYANQNQGVPGGDLLTLEGFAGSGGKLMYTSWTEERPDGLGASYSGSTNQTQVNLNGLFGTGLLTLSNPGWGTFSRGLTASSGTVAATFGNGDAAIVATANTVFNGFLSDTGSQELYANEIAYLTSGGTGGVPEPATWALMILGMGATGAALRSQRRRAFA